jgi:hypothetical protein
MMIASMMIAWVGLGGCQPGSAGSLDPVAAPGVERVDDEIWSHAAIINDGPVSARIVGRWSSERSQTLRVSYRNNGKATVRIDVTKLKMAHPSGDAVLRTAVDATGVNMTDAREDNDAPRMLYLVDKPTIYSPVMEIGPGQTRDLDSSFTVFSNDGVVAEGDRVSAAVPMPAGPRSIAFTLASRSILTF